MKYRFVEKDSDVDEVVEAASGGAYAIDTEFVRERTFFPVLSLVQIAWPGGLVLIDPFKVDMTRLRPLMESDAVALVHACSQDLPIMMAATGAMPARIYDTQMAASFLGYGVASLGALVRGELGVELEKGSQLTDWTRRPLDERALRYAASDVAYLHEVHDKTSKALEEKGRLSWVVEECEGLLRKAKEERNLDEAWWRLKGKSKLRGEARGVAQELARFRLEQAAEQDIPAKRVLSDMAILAMAGRPPKNERDLGRIRGLGNLSSRLASRVLAAVERGRSLGADELCVPPAKPKGQHVKAAAGLCLAWVHQVAQDEGIEPAMLATRDDVDARLKKRPSRLDEGWRHALTADGLDALMNGSAALGVREGQLTLMNVSPQG